MWPLLTTKFVTMTTSCCHLLRQTTRKEHLESGARAWGLSHRVMWLPTLHYTYDKVQCHYDIQNQTKLQGQTTTTEVETGQCCYHWATMHSKGLENWTVDIHHLSSVVMPELQWLSWLRALRRPRFNSGLALNFLTFWHNTLLIVSVLLRML